MRTPLRSTVTAILLARAFPCEALADVTWTGAAGADVFVEANWDLTQSTVGAIDPNVSIDDDVVIAGGAGTALAEIPQLPNQMRLQLASGRTLRIDGARLVAAGNDGVGGPPAGNGVLVEVQNGASFEPYFVVNGTHVDVDATSTAVFGGPGDPLNGSTLDTTGGARVRFLRETPAEFLAEHLSKVTVDGIPAVAGHNITVASDGASGCVITVIQAGPPDTDDDLLIDDDELNVFGTDPNDPDTDGDGTPDGLEVARGLDPLDATSRLERPNVIFVLVDDLGWGDLGVNFQNSVVGPKRLHTPHLDQIAAEGMVLQRHYCPAAVCAPSRASLLCGVHQGHSNVRDNQFDKALENNHTLASTLRRTGYATTLIGKYGLQGNGNSPATWPAYPTKRGFDQFFGYVRHGDGHTHYPAHQTAARPPKQVWDQDTEVSADLDRCYTTDLFTARAKKVIVDHVAATPDQPFFLMLSYDVPHAALHVPTGAFPAGSGLAGGVQWTGNPGAAINTANGTIDSWIHPDDANQPWNEGDKRFSTMVRRLDRCVGDLVQTLRDLDIADDTLVVFSSDNGPHEEAYTGGISYDANAFDSFGPFDGIKRCAWDGGIRVPTLAWWPGTIPAGRVDDTPSQFHDWLATLTELAGWTTPARSDGVSLLPTLTGQGIQEDGVVYVEYRSGSNTPNYPEFDPSHRGRRRGQEQVVYVDGYKGVRVDIGSHPDPFEIYDVRVDPQEATNLAGASPTMVALERRMRDRVLRLRRPDSSAPRPYDDVPVPALAPQNARPGLAFDAFEGFWPWLPRLERLERIASGIAKDVDAARDLTRTHEAGLLYFGYVDVPQTGDWTFEVESSGPALLRIHDAIIVDDDFGHSGTTVSGTVRLEAGVHPLRLWYRTGIDPSALALRWSGPGTPLARVPASALSRPDRSIGVTYCASNPNSSGNAGMLHVEGSQQVADNDVLLVAEALPPQSFGFFLTSKTQGFVPNPAGSAGNLCLGGAIGRFVGSGQVQSSGVDGRIALHIDLGRLPTPMALVPAAGGENWNFQAWFRDSMPSPTSNLTDAVAVTFL